MCHLLFELCTSVLQSICPLLKVSQLPVSLQNVLDVLVHDADDLVDLGLLLGHLPGGLDLADLCGPRDWLAIWPQGPGEVRVEEEMEEEEEVGETRSAGWLWKSSHLAGWSLPPLPPAAGADILPAQVLLPGWNHHHPQTYHHTSTPSFDRFPHYG